MAQNDWRAALGAVDAFVAAHPEIEVSRTGLAVPRACREEFYATLDEARLAIAADVVGDGEPARQAASALRETLIRLQAACGARVELPDALEAFCADPLDGCSQAFLSQCLSYVQGALTADGLMEAARAELPPLYEQLLMAAHETQAAYAFVLALRPRAAYLADTYDQKRIVCTRTDTLAVGRQKYSPVLRLPEAVFECESGVWALKLELSHEIDFYGSKPLRRRDFSAGGDTRNSLGRRLALLYKANSLDDVPFVANRDAKLIFPPTAVVGCVWPRDFGDNLYGRAAFQRILTLGPTRGALLLAHDGSEQAAREAGEPYGSPARIGAADSAPDLFDSFISTL